MATYVKADGTVRAAAQALIDDHYPELTEAGVKVGYLMAHAPRSAATGEPTGPAIKFSNWPAAAIVRLNSLKDRVEGKPDATVIIDGDTWKDRDGDEQAALLDHELYHLEIQRDEEGAIKLDDANRPKLKLRPHDFQLGGFDAIVNRHGTSALEAQSACDLNRRLTQMEFQWG